MKVAQLKITQSHPIAAEMTQWRRHLHAHPETAFEEFSTQAFVAEKLESFGIETHLGLAGTGVVGRLENGAGPRIGLRADMDGLNIKETTDLPYASTHEGKMHACGHDGHMAMLLGAAKYLAGTRNFKGTVNFIFQPAEEQEGGARVMLEEGLFNSFECDCVFGLHNWPELPAGTMALRPGPMMAAADFFEIKVIGQGAHGAMPHLGIDPIVMASEIVLALQTLASRNFDPQDAVVVSVTQIHGGETANAIPQSVILRGTVRSFKPDVRVRLEGRMEQVVKGIASAHGGTCEVHYRQGYPATINHEAETNLCRDVALRLLGSDKVILDRPPSMGSEDFSYFLEARPGCYLWLGTGGTPGGCLLHNSGYDFNDQVAPIGASFWVELTETYLAAT